MIAKLSLVLIDSRLNDHITRLLADFIRFLDMNKFWLWCICLILIPKLFDILKSIKYANASGSFDVTSNSNLNSESRFLSSSVCTESWIKTMEFYLSDNFRLHYERLEHYERLYGKRKWSITRKILIIRLLIRFCVLCVPFTLHVHLSWCIRLWQCSSV